MNFNSIDWMDVLTIAVKAVIIGLVALLEVFSFSSALAPVEGMISTVLDFLPRVLGAGIVFCIGYTIAKIVRELITTSLNAAGFDHEVNNWIGKDKTATPAASYSETEAVAEANNGAPVPAKNNGTSFTNILATITFGIIVVLVGIAALEILGIDALTQPARSVVDTIFASIPAFLLAVALLGRGVLIANFVGKMAEPALAATGMDRAADEAGFFVAGLIKRIIGEGTAGSIVYWATIVLFVAMGLKFMGTADSIINMAFGAIVIGGALLDAAIDQTRAIGLKRAELPVMADNARALTLYERKAGSARVHR